MSEQEVKEIEITPEMIEAGMREYGSRWLGLRDSDDETAREMLAAAYRSMHSARLRPRLRAGQSE
jgi:hypothetical protein